MSLSIDSYGKVAKPRVYVDYVQYLKAVGLVDSYTSPGPLSFDASFNPMDAWDFNPSKVSTGVVVGSDVKYIAFGVNLNYYQETNKPRQVQQFISTINYGGILNHNFGEIGIGGTTRDTHFKTENHNESQLANYMSDYSDILGARKFLDLGSTLYSTGGWSGREFEDDGELSTISGFQYGNADKIKLVFSSLIKYPDGTNEGTFLQGEELRIGSATVGRYFDFPQNADLNVSQTFDYSGIKSNKTISGDEMTQIDYYQSPNWGDFAPWTNIDLQSYQDMDLDLAYAVNYEDNKATRRTGRRSFTVTFSYIDKTDMFPKNFYKNLSGDYEPITEGSNSGFTFDEDESIVSSFLNYTLGGQIPFIFQPDNTKKDFVICRLSKSNSTIKQVAPGVYSVTFSFVETW